MTVHFAVGSVYKSHCMMPSCAAHTMKWRHKNREPIFANKITDTNNNTQTEAIQAIQWNENSRLCDFVKY